MSRTFARLGPLIDRMLDVGHYPGEPPSFRGPRRIFVGTLWVSLVLIGGYAVQRFSSGATLAGCLSAWQTFVHASALVLFSRFPRHVAGLSNIVFVNAVVTELVSTWLYGGLLLSGATAVWIIVTVLMNLILFGVRRALVWEAVFIASLVAAAAMDGRVTPRYSVPDPAMDAAINLSVAMAVTFGVLAYFARQRDRYQRESDDLLHNILPTSVATRLKAGEASIAEHVEDVSVLFADIVAFTPMSASLEASEVVGILNDVFRAFDALVEELGLEKIKTVGDEYMVAAGLPEARPDHAEAVAGLALAMRDLVATTEFRGHAIELRIGISSGPVVAGVIGTHKFSYDLWGATVNTASRMESTGVPGRIQISGKTCSLIGERFRCEPRGVIAVKGLPDMETWFLEGTR